MTIKKFGENLTKVMEEKNISNKQIAQFLGVSLKALYDLLNGKTDIKLGKIIEIAEFTNVPIEKLVFENSKNEHFVSHNKTENGNITASLQKFENNNLDKVTELYERIIKLEVEIEKAKK